MKIIARITTVLFAVIASGSFANADLIWSEDFSSFSDGDSVNGADTSGGTGVITTNGSVAVNDAGQLVLTADGGRETFQIDTTMDIDCGFFTFDLQQLAAPDPPSNSLFLQMTEGGRSTRDPAIPNFDDTLNGSQFSTAQTVNYYFNTSAAAYTYTAPDGSTESIAPGTYDYWQGTTLISNDQNQNANGAGNPADISTLVFNTFRGQSGNTYAFDNLSLNSIVHPVPEPSSALVLVGFSLLSLTRRKRS